MKCPYRKITTTEKRNIDKNILGAQFIAEEITTEDFADCLEAECPMYRVGAVFPIGIGKIERIYTCAFAEREKDQRGGLRNEKDDTKEPIHEVKVYHVDWSKL